MADRPGQLLDMALDNNKNYNQEYATMSDPDEGQVASSDGGVRGEDVVKDAENPRKDLANWRWTLTLIRLYLGALLCGKIQS